MGKCFCTFKSRSGFAFLLAIVVLTVGCLPRGTDLSRLYREAPPYSNSASYAVIKSNILDVQCVSCHVEFNTESGLRKYVVPGDPESSALYREVDGKKMPPGGPPLSGAAVKLIASYINGLKPTPEASPSLAPVAPIFAKIESQLLTPRCIQCHPGFSEESELSPYIVPGDAEGSRLFQAIASGRMPPGGPAVGSDDVALVKEYISSLKHE